jgi:heme-degrading monooxygenase HmoA
MAAITIDETARFVSVISFDLGLSEVSAMERQLKHAVEQLAPIKTGFIGSVVMANKEKSQLLVVSVWESGHAWSAAQYDQEIGRVVSDVVETAKSYDIQTYETVAVVRA